MRTLFLLVVAVALTLGGDWLIKHASMRSAWPVSVPFGVGMGLYGASAFCWFFLMRGQSLAALGVLYSASTVIGLAVLGAVLYGESLAMRHALGLALALASVAVMAGH